MRRWIGIDFDHTIAKNEDIISGERFAKPYVGAQEALSKLKELGYSIIIHSCNRKGWIEEWMAHWNIPYDLIWDEKGKPVCEAYLDDRAVPFRGDWAETLKETLELVE